MDLEQVTILPNDKRLKQLIKRHGNRWEFIRCGNPSCFNDAGVFIRSLDGNHKRWVRPDDIDFDPVELEFINQKNALCEPKT